MLATAIAPEPAENSGSRSIEELKEDLKMNEIAPVAETHFESEPAQKQQTEECVDAVQLDHYYEGQDQDESAAAVAAEITAQDETTTAEQSDSAGNREEEIAHLRAQITQLNEKLVDAIERNSELEHTKSLIVGEVEVLSTEVFEEAHKMVQVERARALEAEKRVAEMQELVSVCKDEMAHLKSFISDLVLQSETTAKASAAEIDAPVRESAQDDAPSICSWKSPVGIEPSSTSTEISDSLMHAGKLYFHPRDAVYTGFVSCLRHGQFSQIASTSFIRRIINEDVTGALFFEGVSQNFISRMAIGRAVRNTAVSLTLVPAASTSTTESEYTSQPTCCHLCDLPMDPSIAVYRVSFAETEPKSICYFCRQKLVACCDFYSYLKMVENGMVKSQPEVVFAKFIALREKIFVAKCGLTRD